MRQETNCTRSTSSGAAQSSIPSALGDLTTWLLRFGKRYLSSSSRFLLLRIVYEKTLSWNSECKYRENTLKSMVQFIRRNSRCRIISYTSLGHYRVLEYQHVLKNPIMKVADETTLISTKFNQGQNKNIRRNDESSSGQEIMCVIVIQLKVINCDVANEIVFINRDFCRLRNRVE